MLLFQGISIYDEFPEVDILLIILGNHLFVFPMENYSGNHPGRSKSSISVLDTEAA